MSGKSQESNTETLCKIISKISPSLSFTIFEVGALPLAGQEEPFYDLLDFFPESQIIAFEIDNKLCNELNEKSKSGIKYFPIALGHREEECAFYETAHPMCSSLYSPNEELMGIYNNLDVAMLKAVGTIDTISLDNFVRKNNIEGADFIKIDIQGAELDVFKGGVKTLNDVVFIVSEVEFISLYNNQPLFGDVCKYLFKQNFMFHKFIGIAGRTIKPFIMNNNPNFATQHMWSDAVFIRDITKLSKLDSTKLLKMGILSYIYDSPDVAFFCFQKYDELTNTNISQEMLSI